jgi:hypothetical protein
MPLPASAPNSGNFSDSIHFGTLSPESIDLLPRKRLVFLRAGYSANIVTIPRPIRQAADAAYRLGLSLSKPEIRYGTCVLEKLPLYSIPERFGKSKSVTIFSATLGPGIDRSIDEFFATGDSLMGLLLDAWGSESVEALANRFDKRLRRGVCDGTIRFSPGYGQVPASANAALLGILGGESVSARPDTGVMVPRKSVLCMIGWSDNRT